jgi:hypothetical protein
MTRVTSGTRRLQRGVSLFLVGALLTACGGGAIKATSAPAGGSKAAGNSSSSFCQEAISEQAKESQDVQAFTTDDPAQLRQFEEAAQAELPIFAAKAPAQIKSAVQTLVAADELIYNDLKSVNFDFSQLGPDVASTFESPQFTQATETVTQYLASVCGISESDPPTN